jgi:ATP-dependent helicase HrpB
MLEPRRLAARAAATRMASLIGEAVGETVGFRTRIDSAVSARTRIEVVTTGLLVRRLLVDPGLEGVCAVILDEIHERSLEADLALAFCLDAQTLLRPDLRLLAMSATLDGAKLSALMGASVIESAGRMHAVAVRHQPRDLPHIRDLPEAMARAIRAVLTETDGDVLAFLPGMAEIRRTEAALDGAGALILPLHGDLPPAAQDLALRPRRPGRADRRRWRLSPHAAPRPEHRPHPAHDGARQPRRGRSARRPRRPRGARARDPALDNGHA